MSIKKKFHGFIVDVISRKFDASDLADVSDQDSAHLRSLAGLFDILDRRPPFDSALEHCLEVAEEVLHHGGTSRIVRAVASTVMYEVAAEFRRMGYDERGAAVAARIPALGEKTRNFQILLLMAHLRLTTYYRASARVVAAVVRALLAETAHAARVDRMSPLSMCVVAAHSSGNVALMEKLVRLSERDLAGILEFTRQEVATAKSPEWAVMLATRAVLIAQIVAKRYPEYEPALHEATAEEARRRHAVSPSSRNVYREVIDAVKAQDWQATARAYDVVALDQSLSAGQRAANTVFAEGARLHGGLLLDEQAAMSAVDRLIDRRIGQARNLVDLDFFCGLMLDNAVEIHAHGGTAAVAIRIADLAGELRAGTAVRGTDRAAPAATEGTALVDMLSPDVAHWEPDTLSASPSDTSFVWISIFIGEPRKLVVFTSVLNSRTGRMTAARHNCDEELSKIVANSIGDTSMDLTDDEISILSRTLFDGLDHETLTRLVVVPDDKAWNMPWLRLAPSTAVAVTVAPSAAIFERVTAKTNPKPKRVLGVFDESLDGALLERDKLQELARRGLIEFDEATSYQDLVDRLTAEEYDLLTIAVHGTSNDGLEYRMMLPESTASPASILRLRLPPVVVLGCCWSGQAAESPDAVATPVGCLSAGATMVVGGLWEINDAVTGRLLSTVYEAYCTGTPFAEAFKSAYDNLDSDDRLEAAGLILTNSSW
ncbi:MAG: CHAT domain-containing protein [Actinomycetota bacterium]|nr:CHAT domain-containing protein [Actinomycetota bacterium]